MRPFHCKNKGKDWKKTKQKDYKNSTNDKWESGGIFHGSYTEVFVVLAEKWKKKME